jgi:hypothetical protein
MLVVRQNLADTCVVRHCPRIIRKFTYLSTVTSLGRRTAQAHTKVGLVHTQGICNLSLSKTLLSPVRIVATTCSQTHYARLAPKPHEARLALHIWQQGINIWQEGSVGGSSGHLKAREGRGILRRSHREVVDEAQKVE